ncbi:hypothetical protein Taro_044688, partial [Colocasia esculenta]|nr:hypothetical protein [Colocasia esculenta]
SLVSLAGLALHSVRSSPVRLIAAGLAQISDPTMSFSGTLDRCKACDKTVYVVDSLSIDGVPFHKSCFKCSHCKGTLAMSNYSSMDGVLYCKPHFEQLFKETGSFSKNFHTREDENKPYKLTFPNNLSACILDFFFLMCSHGGCPLTTSSYAAFDGIIYCKHHFAQLFKEKGSYNHILMVASMKRSNPSATEGDEEGHDPDAAQEPSSPSLEQSS